MNSVPLLALAFVASGYAYVTADLDKAPAPRPMTPLTAYSAVETDDFSVFDVMAVAAQNGVAAPRCDDHAALSSDLAGDFGETRVSQRTTGEDLVMELWASDAFGTWTMVHKGSDGVSCVVSSGTGWSADRTPDDVFLIVPLAS